MGFWFAYLLGGLTFPIILLGSILAFAYYSFPDVQSEFLEDPDLRHSDDDEDVFASDESMAKYYRRSTKSEPDVAAGYFAVTREYVPGGINGRPPERPSPGTSTPPESPSVYQSMYRSLFERRTTNATPSVSSNSKGKNVFFVAMRHGHLMLYDDSDQMEVRHVISLAHHTVSLYGGENEILPDKELFIKRNAIRLSRIPPSSASKDKSAVLSKPFFLFSENCSDKEDFYFALVKHQGLESERPDPASVPLLFEAKHIISLVQRLHSSEEHLQTRWLNGLAGRLFLSLYKTAEIEELIKARITKKIARVKKPNFLSDIVIQRINVGEGVPFITNPKLKDLTVDGEFTAEADIKYTGNFRVEVGAVATIDLGKRIKSRQVNLVLSIVLKKLEGHVLFRLKPPPSNRLWFAFSEMPKMDVVIEPIVSTKQLTWGLILRPIETRIKEVLAETLVLPHWDDISFIDTEGEQFRGGIFQTMSAKHLSRRSESPAKSGLVHEVEKEDHEHEASEHLPHLSDTNEKTMSMPVLAESLRLPNRRSMSNTSSPSRTETDSGPPTPPAMRRAETTRTRTKRSTSITSPAPPLPIVATTNVNAAAEKRENRQENDRSDAVSSVASISAHSRSSSMSMPSPQESPVGSPSNQSIIDAERLTLADKSSLRSFESFSDLDEPPHEEPEEHETGGFLKTLRSRPSSGTWSLKAGVPHPGSQEPSAQDKINSLAAIATAGAAAKRWFNSKRESKDYTSPAMGNQDLSSKPYPHAAPPAISAARLKDRINGLGSSSSSLDQKSGPPPLPTRTEPIAVPQPRKTATPPDLPDRSKAVRRKVPAPPLPPRQDHHDNNMLIVAAPPPGSGPTTPSIEDSHGKMDYLSTSNSTDAEDDALSASNATLLATDENTYHSAEHSGLGIFEDSPYESQSRVSRTNSRASSRKSRGSSSAGGGGGEDHWPTTYRQRADEEDEEGHARSWKEAEEQELRNRLVSEYTGEEG